MQQAKVCAAIAENPGKLNLHELIPYVWPDPDLEPDTARDHMNDTVRAIRRKSAKTGVMIPTLRNKKQGRYSIVIRWPRPAH